MTELLAQIALLLAIFLMMFVATPLALFGCFVLTGHPDLVAATERFVRLWRESGE